MTEKNRQQDGEPAIGSTATGEAPRATYSPPVLTAFGPMAMITGSNRAGSSWDAKFGDFVGKKQGANTSLPSL
jgi:hypothetical protein